ncbi:MAG: hypothetical protein A3J45_15250 [Candidatus Rokubacteria bacterium RIFCSPHIGHO2_02_FULL_69_13]|nr:MAG: hypothetical protein A3J45_15250 [Candidatus Rokubacteria bacterium RIFCSPHIGHO2_02_FULL_69_13]
MMLFRFLVLVGTLIMIVITLVIGATVMLGVGWLAVAIPVLAIIGIIAAARKLWRRFTEPSR